jgi:hypothetical protein
MWAGLGELLHQILMMGTEMVPETSIFCELAQMIAWEDFINQKEAWMDREIF